MRASRDEWKKRVEEWGKSGQPAAEFAAQKGLNAHTLENWKYKLRRQARTSQAGTGRARAQKGGRRRVLEAQPPALPLVELHPRPVSMEGRFEVELGRGYLVRVPASFEADALRRLLGVLEVTS